MTATINASTAGGGGIVTTADSSGILALQTAGTTAVTIDGSQNVGVGVTPSAWATTAGRQAIEIGAIGNALFGAGSSDISLFSNSYINTSSQLTYANTGPAARYQIPDGTHRWYIAPSGTAGTAVSFTQAMTLNASGNLGIGTTPSAWPSSMKAVEFAGGLSVIGYNSSNLFIGCNTYNDGTNWRAVTTAGGSLISCEQGGISFYNIASATAGATQSLSADLIINSAGNVGIGTSSQDAKLSVNGGIDAGPGSVSSPAYGFFPLSTYGSTGMFAPAANTVAFSTSGGERMRIDSSGNVLVTSAAGLGYGTGSGGTVTQATSKTTGVTLNKPTGQITMNAAALANAASVNFALTNSLITAIDVLAVNVTAFGGYTAQCVNTATGAATIRVTNISGGSLSQAVTIQFAIIKGATS